MQWISNAIRGAVRVVYIDHYAGTMHFYWSILDYPINGRIGPLYSTTLTAATTKIIRYDTGELTFVRQWTIVSCLSKTIVGNSIRNQSKILGKMADDNLDNAEKGSMKSVIFYNKNAKENILESQVLKTCISIQILKLPILKIRISSLKFSSSESEV